MHISNTLQIATPNRRAAISQKVRYIRGLNAHPPTHTLMLYHWKVLHLLVTTSPVSVNRMSNKIIVHITINFRNWTLLKTSRY